MSSLRSVWEWRFVASEFVGWRHGEEELDVNYCFSATYIVKQGAELNAAKPR